MKNNLHYSVLFIIFSLFGLSKGSICQNVYIPDPYFKTLLIINYTINTNYDNEIQISEASSYSGLLNIESYNIADLTGIEAFTALTGLDCCCNQLASLDISTNTLLQTLKCNNNQLTSLDVSSNTLLQTLECYSNQLTSLDVSNNTSLTFLDCSFNQITNLNVTSATSLIELYCNHNQLSNLNVSNNTVLGRLECFNNLYTSLDLSANITLYGLFCGQSLLTTLDVSANTSLTGLSCNYSHLTSLDVSHNPNLIFLACSFNQLTSLNVKNGNNQNLLDFGAVNNPNLNCIQVDNALWSTNNWTFIDSTSSFSENCMYGSDYCFIENYFEIFPNPSNGKFTIISSEVENSQIIILNILGKIIYSLKTPSEKVEIDLSGQPKGIYLFQLQSNSKILRNGKIITK